VIVQHSARTYGDKQKQMLLQGCCCKGVVTGALSQGCCIKTALGVLLTSLIYISLQGCFLRGILSWALTRADLSGLLFFQGCCCRDVISGVLIPGRYVRAVGLRNRYKFHCGGLLAEARVLSLGCCLWGV
jgi:hypothetical protein